MKVAIFGGTFDPIHKAHVTMALEAADQFQLDRVLFIPASNPPHKSGLTYAPYEDRLSMAEAACAGEPRFVVSRLEEGPGHSYSIDTIERVRATLSAGDELFFLIGADAFAEMESWHRWRAVVAAVRFIVVSRPGHRYRIPEGYLWRREGLPDAEFVTRGRTPEAVVVPISLIATQGGATLQLPNNLWLDVTVRLHGLVLSNPSQN